MAVANGVWWVMTVVVMLVNCGDVCGVNWVDGLGVWVKAVWKLIRDDECERGSLKMMSLDTGGIGGSERL